jgi:hypothetical protein
MVMYIVKDVEEYIRLNICIHMKKKMYFLHLCEVCNDDLIILMSTQRQQDDALLIDQTPLMAMAGI